MADNNGINLSVLNAEGQPVIYNNSAPATLQVSMTNNIGSDITFSTGTAASVLKIFLPFSITLQELQNMTITLAGWEFAVDATDICLKLTCTGDSSAWANGAAFNFSITGVATQASAQSGFAQINFVHFPAGTPSQVTAPLAISNPPVPGNGDLTKVLELSLDNQGLIIVSPTGDPLQNTLFLNIKNTGSVPLYSGSNMWSGSPQITASFVYGNGTGSLAPDDKSQSGPGSGSAWNIIAGQPYQQPQNLWNASNPSPGSGAAHPQWILAPSNQNQGIIGTGANANVTFSFSNIISFTPPGHTQIMLQFTGFMKDDNTPYDDAVFVLDIVKQNAPPTRGLINFFSQTAIYNVDQPDTAIAIPLRWAMFDVASVNIITSFPGIDPVTVNYPNPQPVAYDNRVITIPGVTQSTAVTITIQSYSGPGGFLNSMQFTAFIQANMFVDPRDGKVYPVVKVNNKVWMAANLDYVAPVGSVVSGPEAQYGRLYTFDAATPYLQQTGGWRLPNEQDWNDLINSGTYAQLIAGGSSGFNAQLNGMANSGGNLSDFGLYGYYWSSVNNDDTAQYVSFSSRSNSVTYLQNGVDKRSALSVRFVRNIN